MPDEIVLHIKSTRVVGIVVEVYESPEVRWVAPFSFKMDRPISKKPDNHLLRHTAEVGRRAAFVAQEVPRACFDPVLAGPSGPFGGIRITRPFVTRYIEPIVASPICQTFLPMERREI